MTKNITLKELRPRLPKVIDDIDGKMDRYMVTKRGRPVAMLMAIDDYEGLLETIEILENPRLKRRLKQAGADIRGGRIRALKDFEKGMGLV